MKKWIIAAVLLALVWLPITACSRKSEPVKAEATKIEQPYVVTKTDPKAAPVKVEKTKPKHHTVKHKPVQKAQAAPCQPLDAICHLIN